MTTRDWCHILVKCMSKKFVLTINYRNKNPSENREFITLKVR